MKHKNKPTRVWLLPIDSKPRPLTETELENLFSHYVETGWEIRFKRLYELMGCTMVQRRISPDGRLPGGCWIDEEGKFKRPRFINPTATVICEEQIVGTCVYVVHEDCLPGNDDEFFSIAAGFRLPMMTGV